MFDAVAVNVAVFDDHIARVDADAELEALVLGGSIVACRHDIGREDGREPALDPLCAQPVLPGDPVRPSILRRLAGFRYMLNPAYTGEML